MLPYLAKIGPVLIPTHAVTMSLAYLVGGVGFFLWAKKLKIDINKLLNWILLCGIASIIGARISAVLFLTSPEKLRWFLEHPVEILKFWKGGMSFYGTVTATLVVGTWYFLRSGLPARKLADVIFPWIAIGTFIQCFGCLAAGCHPGSPTDLPWGITYFHPAFKGPRGVPLHPFPIYLMIITIIGVYISWGWVKIRHFHDRFFTWQYERFGKYFFLVRFNEGELYMLIGMYYSFTRFFVEFTRHPDFQVWYPNWPLPQSQMACILLFSISMFGYFILWMYEDCNRKGLSYPGWLKFCLKFVDWLERVSKRVPWPIREARKLEG